MMSNAVFSSQLTWCMKDLSSASPNVIAPRQSADTLTPLEPNRRYSMIDLPRVKEQSIVPVGNAPCDVKLSGAGSTPAKDAGLQALGRGSAAHFARSPVALFSLPSRL